MLHFILSINSNLYCNSYLPHSGVTGLFCLFHLSIPDEESLRLLEAETRYLPLFSTLSSSPSRSLLSTASSDYRPTTAPPSVSQATDVNSLNTQQQLYSNDNVRPASTQSNVEHTTTTVSTVIVVSHPLCSIVNVERTI